MLEKVDLSNKTPKEEYKAVIPELRLRLGELQRRAKNKGVPVIIVFEGWDAAGKGTLINELLLALDARGFSVHPTNPPNEEERLKPFLWRFWNKTPEKGRIAIFDRSWYGRVLVERVDGILKKKVWARAYDEIGSFERQLVDAGAVIVKFFLHIDAKEQAKRFKKLQSNPATAWKVTKDDWNHHKQYGAYREAIEEMLVKTDSDYAPWTIVEAHDKRFATVKVFQTVIGAIERAVDRHKGRRTDARPKKAAPRLERTTSVLEKVDLSLSLSREEYDKALKEYQARIRDIEHEVYRKRLPVIIVYEGCDAGGKGGNIRRLVQGMDPRGYEVITIAAPNDIERAHHYLWRFWTRIPKAGHIGIFDRSWYGRVLVERVESFCSEEDWKRSYKEINEMEEQWVNFGTVLVKFWLEISKDEQLKRFKEREKDPHKQWKITEEDWRNRKKWDRYRAAIDEMLYRTSTTYAPWTIVEANSKWYARIKALRTVVEEVEKRL